MSFHCEAGQSARVFFKYPDEERDNVSIAHCPVEVKLTQNPAEPGQDCRKEYIIDIYFDAAFWQGSSCGAWIYKNLHTSAQRTGKITRVFSSPDNYQILLERTDCEGQKHISELTQRDGFCRKVTSYTVKPAPGWPPDTGTGTCTFSVIDAKGVLRFTRTEPQCPIYQVVCGGNCPEGEIECGGECVPCSQLTSEISALSARIRQL